MKKLLSLIVLSLILFIPKNVSAQGFEITYQQSFFKDPNWVPFHDQQVEFSTKYVLSYEENCRELSLEGYMRSSTRPQGVGAPSEGILSFVYMPNKNIGIKIGGGIIFTSVGEHARIRGELFLQNELYYIKLIGENGGTTGYYWNGLLILKVWDWFNVGFMADRNWLRAATPEDGFGPRVEINVTGTPLLFFGGAIWPWGDCQNGDSGVQHTSPGAYLGGTLSF